MKFNKKIKDIMEKDRLDIIEGIQTPCNVCKDTEEKPCQFCPYWQFAQLAYFKLKTDPINSISKIVRED